ncbi:MAG: class I tRNA ligase family protein, partial [Patescibacteria group bacterium]|nr:class I tRNA ligase family protein [Patescibacteria group bacterium]
GEVSVSEKDLEKCSKCKSINIKQDEDSLDTWYSSGMWIFSTLGWPDTYRNNKKSGDLKKFHPTQVLETGYEIITLWVSRMIMMSLFALEEIPFENVYLHGMVLDGEGKKMSKSKGNGIDPLIMISKFGTDAVRLSLLIGSTPGNDIRLSEEKIEGQRNFVNKLWNISRYILAFSENKKENGGLFAKDNRQKMTASDKWISVKVKKLIEEVTKDIEDYNFSVAGEKMKEFTWNDLADWYIEASKFSQSEISGQLLRVILSDLLKLWHPYLPFVTEKIWNHYNDNMLMVETWADKDKYEELADDSEGEDFEIIKDIIIAIRNIRAENKVDVGKKIKVQIVSKAHSDKIEKNKELISRLRTGIEEIEVLEEGKAQEDAIVVTLKDIDIYIIGAIDKEKEKERIKKEIDKLNKFKRVIEKKLDNEQFVSNAPEEIIEKEKIKKKELAIRLEKLEEQMNTL